MDGQASRRRVMGLSGREMLAIGSFQQNQSIAICHREVSINHFRANSTCYRFCTFSPI